MTASARRWFGWFVLGCAVACVPLAHAASFDCAKAKRRVEMAICSDPKLSSSDSAMSAAYRADLSRLSSNSVGLLRVDQVQWLAFAQDVCRVNDATTTRTEAVACLQPVYDDRTKQLRGAVGVRGGLAFLTRTQFLAEPETPAADMPAGDHTGFGTLKAEWPAADTDAEVWITWSAAVEARMLKTAGAGQQQELTDGTRRGLPRTWDDAMAAGTDTEITAVLKDVEHGRATTVISTFGMGHGAAHPFGGVETLTWLLKQKRALRASDVFATGAWRHRLGELCWQDLHTAEKKESLYGEVKSPESKPLQDVIADVTNWTLEHDGLHISYPDYAVAPRMAGLEDTVIPWEKLKGLLADGFETP